MMSFLRVPTCRTCLQRLSGVSSQQIRTKTKAAKKGITVRLLEDLPKVGRKGSIVTVAPGRMRNNLYQRGFAEYMTAAALKNVPESELTQQPDTTFIPVAEPEVLSKVELNRLKPAHTISLIETFLPTTLQFSRPTVSPNDTTIHGSISTADICSAVRAIAAASGDEASRVAITPDMITFMDEEEGVDKVKTLGEHKFQIKLKGAVHPVVRAVAITQQVSLE
ncbi:hypothetical protein BZA05DRAFT_7548 [Tricharina praecox]|uniref:uncharacterized protein n=1 Tax=Tricharina praecox TaxID=43433 RepID=UPI00221F4836|nr:uncharacterized protein BZA05DRAFT_7548 [Tricharina praecox]KAI5858557.1 hypothetical protein BZA05DRAFT_7548 [Tricharina praecox]